MIEDDFNGVKILNQEEIIQGIKILREQGFGFRRIGDLLDLNKAAVYMLLNKKWYPKTSEVEQRIILKIRGLGI